MIITCHKRNLSDLPRLKVCVEQMPPNGTYNHRMANILSRLTLSIKLYSHSRELNEMQANIISNVHFEAMEFLNKYSVKRCA